MKEAIPNYYHKFKCIADRCEHNCCIGWEIDIDDETMDIYNSLDNAMGERIRKNIEGDVHHFVLDKDGKCPFLNERGLCDIICECGETAICNICTLHPRFKNFYSDFFETGLGLCCEEAARIILLQEEKFHINLPDDISVSREERDFFVKRQEIFSILQKRDVSIYERLSTLARMYGLVFKFQLDELCRLYLSLERLDEKWTDELAKINEFSFEGKIFDERDFELPFEQLAVYFIFRHLDDAMWDGDYRTIVNFALMSCYLIGALCENYKKTYGSIDLEIMADFARMYSAEVEYSEENLDALMLI